MMKRQTELEAGTVEPEGFKFSSAAALQVARRGTWQ